MPTTEIQARFVDPDGRPLAGVYTYGLHAGDQYDPQPGTCPGADLTIKGVNPKRPRE